MSKQGYQRISYYDLQYWKEANQKLIKLLVLADRIKEIQTNIQNFFNLKKNIYLKTQQQLKSVQFKINFCERTKYVWAGIGVGGGLMSAIGYADQWGAQGGTIVSMISGTLAFAMNEVVKNNLQKEKNRLEKKLANKSPEEFIQRILELEKNYQGLIEIRKDLLANVFKEDVKSEKLWKVLFQFLDKTDNLPSNILKEDIRLPNDARVIEIEDVDDAQQSLLEAPQRLAQQLTQNLENNLVKYGVEEVITDLIREVNCYRQLMYQLPLNLNKSLPSLPIISNQISIGTASLKMNRIENPSVNQQTSEQQVHVLQIV